jgi:hypothetical protein
LECRFFSRAFLLACDAGMFVRVRVCVGARWVWWWGRARSDVK